MSQERELNMHDLLEDLTIWRRYSGPTTIRGGLPVLAEFEARWFQSSWEIDICDDCEIRNLKVTFKSGHPFPGKISPDEEWEIAEDLFDQWAERLERAGL